MAVQRERERERGRERETENERESERVRETHTERQRERVIYLPVNKSKIKPKYILTHGFCSVRLTPIKFESQCNVLVPSQWVNTDIQGIERTAQSVYIGRDVISVPIEKLQARIDTNYGQKNRVLTPLEKRLLKPISSLMLN